VRGPFIAQYAGGLPAGTSYYDEASTVFYPYSVESARAHFEAAGLSDTDGDGFYNHPEGTAGGQNVQLAILVNGDYQTDRNLAEGVVAMLEEAGIQSTLNVVSGNDRDAIRDSGDWDWQVFRNPTELITVVQNTTQLAPTGPITSWNHRANEAGELDLLPWEQEMVDVVNRFIASRDPAERIELMKEYQRLYTANNYAVGLVAYPGALVINKRFANIPAGAPIFMYNWAEDNIIRERVFVPEDQQQDHELHPDTLPGAPGSDGPISAS
jgi:peptide/nickel transport system substrate-binding protein